MLKKLVVVGLVLLVAVAALVYVRAQAILSSDIVRSGVESQLSGALGQPVAIGSIGASIVPRLTMALTDVRIGEADAITIERLDVGTSLGALLSRRIEGATVDVDGARIQLPLPAFTVGADTPASDTGDDGAVTIGSVDAIRLSDVTIVAGSRTLHGDADVVPTADGMTIRSLRLAADDAATVEVTGEITSWQGPVGTLTLRADTLDLVALQAFATDFAAVGLPGSSDQDAPGSRAGRVSGDAPLDIRMTIDTERAVAGDLVLNDVSGQALAGPETLTLENLAFGTFGGQATATVGFTLAETPRFDVRARLSGLDMAALMAFFGTPDAMTGRLSGTMAVSGAGTDAASIMPSAAGDARVDITDGTVKGLALVRTVVVASSGRADAAGTPGSGSEAFSRLGATLTIREGRADTDNLRFESGDVTLDGTGSFGLDGTNIALAGRLQLSEALSKEAGRDLVRYTQEDGRVTVPVRVTGSAGDLSVSVEAAELLRRAITNKAIEEAGDAIREGLGGLFGR